MLFKVNFEELFEYVQVYDEYNHLEYNPEPARLIIDEIYDEYEDVLRDCVDLSEGSEYENLMLECYDLVDDMKYFEGVEDHFFELLENLSVTPDECLFVGDSGVDMQTAKNAKTTAIGVLWGFRLKDELCENGADYIVLNPMEILKIAKEN